MRDAAYIRYMETSASGYANACINARQIVSVRHDTSRRTLTNRRTTLSTLRMMHVGRCQPRARGTPPLRAESERGSVSGAMHLHRCICDRRRHRHQGPLLTRRRSMITSAPCVIMVGDPPLPPRDNPSSRNSRISITWPEWNITG